MVDRVLNWKLENEWIKYKMKFGYIVVVLYFIGLLFVVYI